MCQVLCEGAEIWHWVKHRPTVMLLTVWMRGWGKQEQNQALEFLCDLKLGSFNFLENEFTFGL